eukprot:TRINITY_DN361_c0_g1_i3.p1 TRINITY_DN361_c0_g1~~TRINITY_DN361_c0_g1_i3.p1  ORF type:complete len:173 (+),score=23.42 TRINITY_DN361_c0_g1_i3:34-519(+)
MSALLLILFFSPFPIMANAAFDNGAARPGEPRCPKDLSFTLPPVRLACSDGPEAPACCEAMQLTAMAVLRWTNGNPTCAAEFLDALVFVGAVPEATIAVCLDGGEENLNHRDLQELFNAASGPSEMSSGGSEAAPSSMSPAHHSSAHHSAAAPASRHSHPL